MAKFAVREHAQEIISASSFLSVGDSIFGGSMSEQLTLPVLPLDDEVVLPGMVVPLELSQQEARAAIDAARVPTATRVPGIRSEAKPRVLLVPRLSDRGLAGVGTLAVIDQEGRLPGGEPGAVVRGISRVRLGSGTTGSCSAPLVAGTVHRESRHRAHA